MEGGEWSDGVGNWSAGAKSGAIEVGNGAWSQGWSDRSGNWSDGAQIGAIEVGIGAMEHKLER